VGAASHETREDRQRRIDTAAALDQALAGVVALLVAQHGELEVARLLADLAARLERGAAE
jgi:hypothetical protein